MPRGRGIYEDEPREHRRSYLAESGERSDEPSDDPAPDDLGSKDAGEPTA